MRAIQEELGGEQEAEDEIEQWRMQLAELDLPEKTAEKIEKEIKRFSYMQPSSAESTVIRSYIETILALPWNKESETDIDLRRSEKILDEDHYGLNKVKERVLEYLAVITLSQSMKGPILCLVGPPGTGKTSIVKSIARSINREYVRMSLGGVRDEAEIRGHRRTYIGAIPGRIINCIKEAGTKTRYSSLMKLIRSDLISAAIRPARCWRYWILSRTRNSQTTILRHLSIFRMSCSLQQRTRHRRYRLLCWTVWK